MIKPCAVCPVCGIWHHVKEKRKKQPCFRSAGKESEHTLYFNRNIAIFVNM